MGFLSRNSMQAGAVTLQDPQSPVFTIAPPVPVAGEGLTIDFRGVFAALFRRKWWIILPTLVFMLAGLAIALSLQPRYLASVQILVDPRDVQVIRSETPFRVPTNDASTTLAENALAQLRSTNLLMQVVEREKLFDDPEFIGKPGMFSAPVVEATEVRRLRAMNALDRKLSVRRAERSSVVEASVGTTDAAKSARIANTLADLFLIAQASAESDTARKAAQSTSARLAELGRQVQKAEQEVEAYKAKNNLQTANGRLVGEQQLQELNTQLVLARARSADARSKYDSVRTLSVSAIERGALPDAATSTVIAQLRLKLAEAARLEADARTRLGERHPEMASLSAQTREARSQISDELNRLSQLAKNEFERARAAEDTLSKNLDQLRSQSSDTSEASVRLRELDRQAEASRSIYNAFLKRTRELSEQEEINPLTARVISQATPPQYQTGVSKALVLAGSTIAGFMIGLLMALVAEQLDGTLRNKRQFQDMSGLPVLAHLGGPEARLSGEGLRALVMDAPRSSFALGACRIADSIAADSQAGRPRSALFVSAGGVPSTELTLNVAIAAAQATWRTLMIDADGSGAGVSRHLDVRPNAGLAEVVSRRARLSGSVLTDERTHVRILPMTDGGRSGAAPRLSPQHIASDVLSPEAGFELVFVDGGDITRNATAYSFAPVVDDIVLVAASGQTSSRDFRDAMDLLQPFAAKLRGVVTL